MEAVAAFGKMLDAVDVEIHEKRAKDKHRKQLYITTVGITKMNILHGRKGVVHAD